MQLNRKALGLALGILWGAGVFIATAVTLMVGGGAHLELLGKFYLGFTVSWAGAFVGLIYGFVDGFIAGWLVAWLYNRFAS